MKGEVKILQRRYNFMHRNKKCEYYERMEKRHIKISNYDPALKRNSTPVGVVYLKRGHINKLMWTIEDLSQCNY
jgi:hypothetical protein